MKVVAIEEHFLTNEINDAWRTAPVQDPTSAFGFGEIGRRLHDLGEERLKLMDETGVDVQVLSLNAPSLHNLGSESVALARATNDFLAETVSSAPERFQGLAALPMPAPKAAVKELDRCTRELGFPGAMVCGRTRKKNLDHPDFWPLFECAESLGVPIFVHPQVPQRAVREAYYSGFDGQIDLVFSSFGLGWHYEAGIQFVRMVLRGVFDRFPGLQIILGHWGEVVLFYIERMSAMAEMAKLDRSLGEYVRENLYVTASGMFSKTYLQRSVDIVGVERTLFSTDYPYQYNPGGEARMFLDEAELDAAEKELFAHGNWERLTGQAPRR